MSGLFGISGNSQFGKNVASDLFWGTFYQQHLGEEFCGVSLLSEEGEIVTCTRRGHFRPAFSQEQELWNMKSCSAIGYCGSAPEPFYVDTGKGDFAVCFTGNILNAEDLKDEFKSEGRGFVRGDEIELISKIIAQESSFVEGLRKLEKRFLGAYSILLMTREGLYAYSDGRWPLVVGKKDGQMVVATSSAGFSNLKMELVKDIPGGIVLLKDGEIKEEIILHGLPVCSFMWVYTGFPPDRFRRIAASEIRKRLGAELAVQDAENGFIPDIVVPIPDSGRFHAIGYHQQFTKMVNNGMIARAPLYDEVLLKYPYAGRSFTPQSKEIRELEASIKQVPSGEDYKGKKAVVVDDSIVRGTQTQNNLVPKLRAIGLEEIHLRIGSPELRSYCPWGKTTKRGETLANSIPDMEQRRKYLGVDSLIYNSVDTLEEILTALGIENFCMDCSKEDV